MKFLSLSGWQDSNLRPPAPKAGAITGLRYTPFYKIISELCEGKSNLFLLECKYLLLFIFIKNHSMN